MPLLSLMLREEYRLHISYSSRRMFLAIPVFVFLLSLAISLTMRNLQETIDLWDMMTNLNAGVFLYGISVGAFGFLGSTYVERRQGKKNFMVTLPALLPMSYRSTFLGMYLRDIIFYVAMILGPAFLGLAVAAPIASYSPLSVLVGLPHHGIIVLVRHLLELRRLGHRLPQPGTPSRSWWWRSWRSWSVTVSSTSTGWRCSFPPWGSRPPYPRSATILGTALFYLALSVASFLAFTAIAILFVAESFESAVRKKGPSPDLLPSYLPRLRLRPLLSAPAGQGVRGPASGPAPSGR